MFDEYFLSCIIKFVEIILIGIYGIVLKLLSFLDIKLFIDGYNVEKSYGL